MSNIFAFYIFDTNSWTTVTTVYKISELFIISSIVEYWPLPISSKRSATLPADFSRPKCTLLFFDSLSMFTWVYRVDIFKHNLTLSVLVLFCINCRFCQKLGPNNRYTTHKTCIKTSPYIIYCENYNATAVACNLTTDNAKKYIYGIIIQRGHWHTADNVNSRGVQYLIKKYYYFKAGRWGHTNIQKAGVTTYDGRTYYSGHTSVDTTSVEN